MADGPFILIDLVVVAAFMRLVPKEMNSRVLGTGDVLLGFEVLEAICLIPTLREDVKGYLAPYRVPLKRRIVRESLVECVEEWIGVKRT